MDSRGTADRVSGVILAGGKSRRMGEDKRFLVLDGVPLLVRVMERLRPFVGELILVANDPESLLNLGAEVVEDQFPGKGVLAGVHSGLLAARGDWAFVVAADLPFLNPALLRRMVNRAMREDSDIVVPRWRGELEPLHALYRSEVCARAAEDALRRHRGRIISFYPALRVVTIGEDEIQEIDPEGSSFFNVNTPEDWRRVCDRLGCAVDKP